MIRPQFWAFIPSITPFTNTNEARRFTFRVCSNSVRGMSLSQSTSQRGFLWSVLRRDSISLFAWNRRGIWKPGSCIYVICAFLLGLGEESGRTRELG